MAIKDSTAKQTSDVGETDILVEDLTDKDSTISIDTNNKETEKNVVDENSSSTTDNIK